MKLILPYFRKNLPKILLGLLAVIIVDAVQVLIPQVVKRVIDILAQGSFDNTVLIRQCLLVIFLGFVMAALRFGWRWLLMGNARFLERGIRDELFSHILELDMAFYDKKKTGDIMAHATSDINHIRMAFGIGFIVLADAMVLGTTTFLIMLWTNVKLTLLAMLPMPFLILFIRYLGKRMHSLHRTAQESYSSLTELIRESFFGIRVLKVFNFEELISEKVCLFARDYFGKNLKRSIVSALLRPLMNFFFHLSTLIVLFYGGALVIREAVSPGELVAFIQYLGILSWPIIAIGWMTNLFQRGLASLKRVQTLLESQPKVTTVEHPIFPDKVRGKITFENVDFSYDGMKNSLSGINLDIRPGGIVGISGPPGSGKTSLVQLIARLYNVDSGKIILDGVDISAMDVAFLRRQIAFMPQEAFLFSGTIRENIAMGRNIPDEKLKPILSAAMLEATVNEMPDGLSTIVGERGITLSGGQKQRIALARTLLLDRKIIILDDPISQMDTQTAKSVMQNINRLNRNATFIIISHRISALASCDRIYILKDGCVTHHGPHKELLETDAFYKESYLVQQFERKEYGS